MLAVTQPLLDYLVTADRKVPNVFRHVEPTGGVVQGNVVSGDAESFRRNGSQCSRLIRRVGPGTEVACAWHGDTILPRVAPSGHNFEIGNAGGGEFGNTFKIRSSSSLSDPSHGGFRVQQCGDLPAKFGRGEKGVFGIGQRNPRPILPNAVTIFRNV